ncbi:MAG: RNA 3'-phosphate cyclase, partial [Deltaproteobacteria bacterium]|nr:RNA 3'-phosphate cyclase [Deltaproteobacteria bacterium]
MSAKAAAAITNGRLEGAELNSQTMRFLPGRITNGRYCFDVASLKVSAGAAGLIFQTIIPVLSLADGPSEVSIAGGTHVPWSPPADYLEEIFLPVVIKMGVSINMTVHTYGFYPLGGGRINIAVKPCSKPLRPLNLTERGKFKSLKVTSAVANLSISIAERQRDRVIKRFQISRPTFMGAPKLQLQNDIKAVSSPGKGTFLFILTEFENIRAGFTGLGAIGKRAEAVADETVDEFLQYVNRKGTLDPYLADQMVLYMALAAGQSTISTTRITNHLLTNIWIIEQFLPMKFAVKGDIGEEGMVSVKGIAFCR